MTVNEWLEQNFNHITLYTSISKNGTILNVPEYNVTLTVGLISTDNKDDFARLVFKYLPVGTIIEPINDEWYKTKLVEVRTYLTMKLLTDNRCKQYLDILERRDRDRWKKDEKQTSVKATTNQGINLEFVVA